LHALLLQREAVIGLFLGLVVVEQGSLERVRRERRFHRCEDVGEVLELALERPLAGCLYVVGVGIGDIRRRAGIQRRHRLRNHVLDSVLRQFDLDIGFGLELLDRLKQGVVLGLVKALDPPDRNFFLSDRRGHSIQKPERGD